MESPKSIPQAGKPNGLLRVRSAESLVGTPRNKETLPLKHYSPPDVIKRALRDEITEHPLIAFIRNQIKNREFTRMKVFSLGRPSYTLEVRADRLDVSRLLMGSTVDNISYIFVKRQLLSNGLSRPDLIPNLLMYLHEIAKLPSDQKRIEAYKYKKSLE